MACGLMCGNKEINVSRIMREKIGFVFMKCSNHLIVYIIFIIEVTISFN